MNKHLFVLGKLERYLIMKNDEPYHNEGFGVAYMLLLFFILILPAIILFTSLGTWDMFWKMHLPDGDCWENSRHEKVCKPTANCKIGRNFCD